MACERRQIDKPRLVGKYNIKMDIERYAGRVWLLFMTED